MAECLHYTILGMHHDSPGVCLKELHSVLEKTNVTPSIAKDFVNSFNPTNELEKTVKLRMINKYKLHCELERLLREGDAKYVGGALKCDWFFEEIYVDNIKEFFDSLFPCLSYAARMRVIHKLAKYHKNEVKCDKLFSLIKERYGIQVAFRLLPACSEDLIAELLYSLRKPLHKPIAKLLYIRHPKLFQAYLLYLLECRVSGNPNPSANIHEYDEIFKMMASRETDTFVKLFDKYAEHFPWMNLGRGTTKKIVKKSFPTIVKHSNELKRFFKIKILKKTLSADYLKELHFALLPKDLGGLKAIMARRYAEKEFISLLCGMKGALPGEIFSSNFEKAYSKQLIEALDIINQDLAVMLPSTIRCTWALAMFSNADEISQRAEYIAYLEPSDALPKLKQLIPSQTEVQGRVHIVKCMFTCLKVNKAEKLVRDVLSFVTSRLRNDQSNIREKTLDELTSNFELSKLENEDWKEVEGLLNLVSINREEERLQYYIIQILEKWIEFRVSNKMPADELLHKLCKLISNYYKFEICSGRESAESVLLWFIEHLPQKLNDKNRSSMAVNLFAQICHWNKLNQWNRIEMPDWILDEVNTLITESSYQSGIIMEALRGDSKLMKKLVKELFPTLCSPRVLISKLREDPHVISIHLEKIMNSVLKQNVKDYLLFFKKLKMYTHSGLPTKVIEILNANLHEGSSFTKTCNSIILLSYFVPAHVFIQIISPYYPKSSTIDDFSEDGHSVFDIQKQIALCLKNLNPPCEMLEPMRKFCSGDYLKLVVGSLHSLCLKCSEQVILPQILTWLDCGVSQRKHYIRAYCKVAPINDALDLLEKTFVNEKNTSLRVLVFDHIYGFFLSEPSNKILQTLKHTVEAFSIDDQEPLKKLYSVSLIPTDFFSEYINMLWSINEDQQNIKKMRVIKLIDSSNISFLTSDQCNNIIDLLLSDEDVQFQTEIIRFSVDYILCEAFELSSASRLSRVADIFLQHPENLNTFDVKRSAVFMHKQYLSQFLNLICHRSFLKSNTSNNDILLHFASYFKDDSLRNMFFKELLFLECGVELGTKNILSNSYIHFLASKITSCYNKVGGEIISILVNVINSLIPINSEGTWPKEKTRFKLAQRLISIGMNPIVNIVAIKLLPREITESTIDDHTALLTQLMSIKDTNVQIFLNEYLKNLSSTVSE